MESGDQVWEPIVVDTPTMAFHARPPSAEGYTPDTICDGWSTPDFVVRLASTRGYAHRYAGTTRQDAVQVRWHRKSGALVLAVADGVSAAPRSEMGAAIACEAAVIGILKALDRNIDEIDWTNIVAGASSAMVSACGGDIRSAEDRLATTLTAGVVRPLMTVGGQAAFVQIGDTSAWVLQKDGYHGALNSKISVGIVPSGTAALPRVPDEIVAQEFHVPADAVLLVGTDGFGDPLGDGTGLVGQLFAKVLREPPPALGFAHTLDFSRETFDDDRTLVAIWSRRGHIRGSAT